MRNVLGIGANFHASLLNFYISLYNINLNFDKGYYQWKDLNSIALQTGIYFSIIFPWDSRENRKNGLKNHYDKVGLAPLKNVTVAGVD